MRYRFRRLDFTISVSILSLLITVLVISAPNAVHSQTRKPTAEKDRVKELESRAKQCRTADEARILYGIFLADEATSSDEREKARPQFDYWTDAAKKELVRVGAKWMTKQEGDALKADADKLVDEAIQSLQLDDTEGADKKLKKASSIYPEHLPSLYLLGLGACLNEKYDAGEKQFTQCLARSPNNVPALNNTAVCEVKNKKYSEALHHWEMAANIDPENPDVKYNLSNFIAAAAKQQIPKVERRWIDRATTLLSSLNSKEPVKAAFLVRNDDPPSGKDAKSKSKPAPRPPVRGAIGANAGFVISKLNSAKGAIVEESQIVGNGSGFVIAPGYVLTNRHVVADAQSLTVQSPDTGELLAAKVISTGDPDLALLECKGLNAPPVPFASTAPGRGTEVMAFGFPLSSMVGKGLKTTRGIITGLPEKANKNMFLLDVPVNPGNSGGPLCDQTGRVVGVVTAKTFSDTFIEGYGLAIPLDDAKSFVRGILKNWEPAVGADAKLEWPAVDASLSKSTVMILIYKKR